MKILLIYPPWQFKAETPPLGLGYLAAILEKLGEQVKILDLDTCTSNTWEEQLHKELGDNKFQIAGISAMTPLFTSALKVAQIIKEVDPSIKIIMGGAHPTIYPDDILKNYNFIDIIVRGEGEETLAELMPFLRTQTDLKDVTGISYRKDGEIIHNPNRPLIKNLDRIPFPALHLLPMDKYHNQIIPGKKMMTLISSRGCPFNCYFCFKGIFGRRFRARSAENIVEEIEQIVPKYGINHFYFYDDTFTLDKNRVFEFCKLLKERDLRITWSCVTRVDCVTPSMLLEMKKTGCYSIHYGVETGDPKIMELTRKGITLEQVKEVFRWTKDAGIKTKAYFMIGHPWDTKATIKRTIKFSAKISADFVQFAIVTPFPSTKLWDIATERGVIDPQNINWNNFILTGEYLPVRPIPLSEDLSWDKLNTWVKRGYSENELIKKILIKKFGKIGISIWYISKIIRKVKPLRQMGEIILSKIGWI